MSSGDAERNAGKYRILSRIAAGGMGEVYQASMESLGGVDKPVALKLVKSNLAADPDFAALFVEEAKVAMSLSHANVVQSFDVGRIDDRWFLAMEYVEGVDLSGLLVICHQQLGQPIPQRHVILIAVEALKGLDYAHRRRSSDGAPLNIVHRDVSPGNLLISFEGEVKIADFGIAKSTLRAVGSMHGTVKGKLPYMAPEQLRGQVVDRRADLYSVGAVLYEMLTAQRIVSDEEGPAAIPKVLKGEWAMPSALVEAIPVELERIVVRALSLEADDRYPNAAAMRQDLERLALDQKYLLSSADLADFVAEVLDRDERDTHDTLSPASIARGLGRAAAVGDEPTDAEARASNDPFDALLGQELMAVQTGDGFSVFTAGAGGRRLATAAPTPTPDPGEPAAPSGSTTPGKKKRTAVLGGSGGGRESSPKTSPQWTAVKERGSRAGSPVPARSVDTEDVLRRAAGAARIDTGPPILPQRRTSLVAGIAIVAALALVGGGVALWSGDDDAQAADADDGSDDGSDVEVVAEAERPPTMETVGMEPAELPAGVDPPPELEVEAPQAGRTPSETAMRPRDRGTMQRGRTPTERPDPPAMTAMMAPAGTATLLSINTDPWSYVYLDGTRLGATPQVRRPVSPGRHQIRLQNPSENLERTITVEVSEGEHERLVLDLRP